MNSSKRKLPKNIERSITTRAEGMVRKAMELSRLGARVAIYIEKRDEDKAFRFKTHSAMEPNWGPAANFVSGESEQGPSAAQSPNLRSSPSLPDMESLDLNWPSMGGGPKTEPLPLIAWDDIGVTGTLRPQGDSGASSAAGPPPASKPVAAEAAPRLSRKRPVSMDDAPPPELRTAKRAKRKGPLSPWFKN
ncbi:hypothetical protein NW762_012851 [Fusarium torreyae]|uniref:Uncharacterized protein n=1 Tax=Fusarium torreyae TaxID=1237075 RepID=A0A9W8V8A3_9HYPO|nr:hypothetical protein NW762_012851 [Fusarium torreyae]